MSAAKVPVVESYSSAVSSVGAGRTFELNPPVIRTLPFPSRVAVWLARGTPIVAVIAEKLPGAATGGDPPPPPPLPPPACRENE